MPRRHPSPRPSSTCPYAHQPNARQSCGGDAARLRARMAALQFSRAPTSLRRAWARPPYSDYQPPLLSSTNPLLAVANFHLAELTETTDSTGIRPFGHMVTPGQIPATKESLLAPFSGLLGCGHVRSIRELTANWLLSHSYRSATDGCSERGKPPPDLAAPSALRVTVLRAVAKVEAEETGRRA